MNDADPAGYRAPTADIAMDTVAELAAATQASGTDYGLGIEARSRALTAGSQPA